MCRGSQLILQALHFLLHCLSFLSGSLEGLNLTQHGISVPHGCLSKLLLDAVASVQAHFWVFFPSTEQQPARVLISPRVRVSGGDTTGCRQVCHHCGQPLLQLHGLILQGPCPAHGCSLLGFQVHLLLEELSLVLLNQLMQLCIHALCIVDPLPHQHLLTLQSASLDARLHELLVQACSIAHNFSHTLAQQGSHVLCMFQLELSGVACLLLFCDAPPGEVQAVSHGLIVGLELLQLA
mmetsp:Transcript_5959/g.14083  ORF Transcript_5959/g.14083 Transcript_5959/m.14083 type:complete len:237 (+) Transcript_5959:838-1548(+)